MEPVVEEISIALKAVMQREQLSHLETLFRTLFERLADAVYLAEFDGTILEANEAACRQSGYSHEELLVLNIMKDLAYEEPAPSYVNVIDRLRAGELVRFDEVKRRKDGMLYVTECAVTGFDYQGRTVTLSINRDVTLHRETERRLLNRSRELEALLRASKALTTTLKLDELIARIQVEVASLIPCDGFFVALLDSRKRELRLEIMVERGVSLGKQTIDADPSQSLSAWVTHTGKPLLVGDMEREAVPAQVRQVGEATRSWLGVPLVARDVALGVMSVQSFSPDAFSEDDVRVLSTFAGLAAAAVHNARLHTGVTALQSKLLAVERAARKMKLAESRDELYAQLLDATEDIFGYGTSGILEGGDRELKIALSRGSKPALGARLALDGPGITVAAWNSASTEYVPDVSADERYVAGTAGVRSELAIPFRVGARLVGVFAVQSSEEKGISAEDRNLLEILTAHMAVTLAVLEKLETMKTLSETLQRLHHAVHEMQRCRSIDELCQAAVHTASVVLGLSLCNVGLAEGELLMPRASSAATGALGQPVRRGEGVAGRTWETGRPLWGRIADFPFAAPAHPDHKHVISVPIGKAGVFQAISTAEVGFTETDVALAEILTAHIGSGLQRIELEEELRDQATRDALTGLHNRRFLAEVLKREMHRAARYGHPISVIMADIDHFKHINDRFGHLQGDQVLREVAELLTKNVRASDYVFRYGGEEFVILLPETATRADEVITRLRKATHEWSQSSNLKGLDFGLTMGSAVWDPRAEQEASPETLLQRADEMLYSFKQPQVRRQHG